MPSINPANTESFSDASNGTSRNVTAPSDAANNAVYIFAVLDGNGGALASSGFTAVLDNIPIPVTSPTARAALLRKIEGGSPPGSYAVTSANERAAGLCFAITGDNGVDGTPPTPNTGTGSTATCPAATPSQAGTLVLRLVGTDNTSLTHGTISGYTVVGSVQATSGGTVSVQFKELATADALSSENVSLGASEEWTGATVIILGIGGGSDAPGAEIWLMVPGTAVY